MVILKSYIFPKKLGLPKNLAGSNFNYKFFFFFSSGDFIEFEAVTLVPFEPKLIDFGLMSVKQIEWLNTYNELIVNKVRLERVEGVMITLESLL